MRAPYPLALRQGARLCEVQRGPKSPTIEIKHRIFVTTTRDIVDSNRQVIGTGLVK